MKKQFIIFGIIFLFFSCSKKEKVKPFPFDEFIFSSAGLRHKYSIKFTKNDTVYLRRVYPEPKENFYAILKISEREKFNECTKLDFENFVDSYEKEGLFDGTRYLINVSKEGKNKRIFLYGNVTPHELEKLIGSLMEIKDKLNFIPINKNIDFGDLKSIFPTPPPIPVKKVN